MDGKLNQLKLVWMLRWVVDLGLGMGGDVGGMWVGWMWVWKKIIMAGVLYLDSNQWELAIITIGCVPSHDELRA